MFDMLNFVLSFSLFHLHTAAGRVQVTAYALQRLIAKLTARRPFFYARAILTEAILNG